MRLNSGISKVISWGLTILITLLALFWFVGLADTVQEVRSAARGYYSEYSEDQLFHLREDKDYGRLWQIWRDGNFAVIGAKDRQKPYLSAGVYFHDAMLKEALEQGGAAYADEAARLSARLEEEAAAMQDEECRAEIDSIVRGSMQTGE